MVSNFEEKLVRISGPEQVKGAKALLKKDALSCAYRDENGAVVATFQDRNSVTRTSVQTGDDPACDCSCGKSSEKLCEHAIAAIMYCGRFKNEIKPIDDGVSKYAGLKYESLETLAGAPDKTPTAVLSIAVESEFPHVPSKWENSVLNVRLQNGEREYLGNLNNLRQLYFEKSLTVTLKVEQFSLQDQQIIRYLAVNGEPDGSKILLNSEQTAEFFHCLVHFKRFTRDGRTLLIHSESAEPIILKKKDGPRTLLSPGIRVGQALLALHNSKIITGRSGCWVGKQGEYFFVPGTLDVTWLRNFFRTGVQEFPGKLPDTFTIDGKFPVPVLDSRTLELEKRAMTILLRGGVAESGEFHLKVDYIYGAQQFSINSGRLGRDGSLFYRRDEESERAFENELAMFGFVKEGDDLVLSDNESIGVFIDQVMPIWLRQRHELALEAPLARVCRGGAGLPDAQLDCRIGSQTADGYLLQYSLHADNVPLSFRELTAAARENRVYARSSGGHVIRLGGDFRDFLLGAETVMQHLDEKNHTFLLPFYATGYWSHIADHIPGAVPGEFRTAFTASAPTPDNVSAVDFEFKGSLRGYQLEGVNWLKQMTDHNFNVILADEMGLGKTIQVLAFLAGRKKRNMPPAVVLCPASLVTNWAREAARFVPEMKVGQLAGSGRDDIYDAIDQYDLVIMSYSTARHDAEKLHRTRFSYLILDEAQHIKNPGTANALNCKALEAANKIVLTGTPLENSPDDLWSIFDFLHAGMLGSFSAFRKYYAEIGQNPRLQQDLAARVAPFIKRRTKALVAAELPPKQEHILFCEMPPAQRALYEEVLACGRAQLSRYDQKDSRANTEIFTTLLRLRQICCHPQLLPDFHDKNMPSAKLELLHELLMENVDSGHKVLLFSQFTSMLSAISPMLDAEKVSYEYLDGGTRNRQTHVDHFNNDPSVHVFLLSLKAGGTGLNLASADTVIIYDPWWNPAVENQASDRTHRIGQTRAVNSIKLLVKDSIEEKILALQAKKQEIFDNVIDNPNSFADKLTIEELRFLLD